MEATSAGSNICDGPMEPEPGVKHPRADAKQQNAADGDGRVVEVGFRDGVRHRQGEEHSEECHPGDGDPADDEAAPPPEVERPRDEGFPRRRDAEEDRQRVGDVQPRRRHADHRLERHLAPQRLQAGREISKRACEATTIWQLPWMQMQAVAQFTESWRCTDARTERAMTNATATENQTALKGTSSLFTRCQTRENGIAPSLEKAYAILHALGES